MIDHNGTPSHLQPIRHPTLSEMHNISFLSNMSGYNPSTMVNPHMPLNEEDSSSMAKSKSKIRNLSYIMSTPSSPVDGFLSGQTTTIGMASPF
jgi:hypothetical protein